MSIAPGEFLTRRRRRSRVPLRFTPGWYACGVFPRGHLLKALIAECDYAKQKRRLTPALRDGADLEPSITGAEAPAYYQGVPPDFAEASSGRPGRYV